MTEMSTDPAKRQQVVQKEAKKAKKAARSQYALSFSNFAEYFANRFPNKAKGKPPQRKIPEACQSNQSGGMVADSYISTAIFTASNKGIA